MNQPITMTFLWIVNLALLFQTSQLVESLLFTFISTVAIGLTTALLWSTYYWYSKSSQRYEEIVKLKRENHRLKQLTPAPTLSSFIDPETVQISSAFKERFDKDELEQLAFDLDIPKNWDNSISKTSLGRRLIRYAKNRNEVQLIYNWIRVNRPDIIMYDNEGEELW